MQVKMCAKVPHGW